MCQVHTGAYVSLLLAPGKTADMYHSIMNTCGPSRARGLTKDFTDVSYVKGKPQESTKHMLIKASHV